MYYVWSEYKSHKVPDRKRGKYIKKFITEDYRREMIFKKSSRNLNIILQKTNGNTI